MPDLETERATVTAFVERQQQQRILSLLERKKGRVKFRGMLAHSLELKKKNSTLLAANQQNFETIVRLLQKKGAPNDCYVISQNPEFDGTNQQLSFVLDEIIGFGYGTIVSCIPGILGYYEGEDIKERYLLHAG